MWKKRIRQIVALLLALILLDQFSCHILAQEELSHRYISAVSVGTADQLKAQGYTVVENNINEGGTPIYIGYKYTHDPDDAITDVSALSMYGGYSPLTYKEMLLNDSEGVKELGTKLQTAAAEFRTQYNAGNPYAEIAYNTLNAMCVPDTQGNTETLLGDYLLSSARSLTDFKKLGLMCSNVVMSFILNQLCFGTADNSAEGTWLQRLSANGPLVFADETGEPLDEGSVNEIYAAQYDAQYMQRAQKLYVAVAEFAANYTEAAQRSGSIEAMSVPDQKDADAAVEEVCDAINNGTTLEFDEAAEKIDTDGDDNYGDVFPLGLYALLDRRDDAGTPVYPYGTKADGSVRTLAEFFVEVGSMEDGEDAYRMMYPLIAAQNGVTPLNAAQEALLYLAGFTAMISVACSDDAAREEARVSAEEKVRELRSLNNGKPVSVWYDVNTDIYDETQKGVYWTSEFVREAAAHNRYDLLTKPSGVIDVDTQGQLFNAILYLSCVLVGAIGAAMIVSKIAAAAWAIKGLALMITCAVKFVASVAVTYTTAACVACVVGTAFLVLAALVLLAIIVIALVKLFMWLFEDDEEQVVLTEIPQSIYDYNDNGAGSAVIYRAVTTVGTEKAANLNDGVNAPWVALYYSKDKALGEPISADFDGDTLVTAPFNVRKGSQNAPEGYCSLKFFGSVTAANLNEGRSGVKGIFGFFHRAGDAISEDEDEGMYLSEVKLASASGKGREEAAKTELIDSGYSVIDYNLTSDGSIAAYIGYKTSDDATKAITDLRVAYSTGQNENNASISYGGATYGCCGSAGNLLLMESKWACVGTPILASDLIVTDTLADAPAGYEPVNLFCGGPAFDFNNCNNWEVTSEDDGKEDSSKWKNHSYIYFNPSVKFTSGTAYLGGLAFFSGTVDGYIADSGWTRLNNANLGNGLADTGITYDLSGVQDGKTVLCYSTTYNPYRAIYDVQHYGAEVSAQGIPYNISLGGKGAVTCDVFQQSGGKVGNNRMLRVTHAYRSSNPYEGGGLYDPNQYLETVGGGQEFTKDNGTNVEWYKVGGKTVVSNIRCTGLFVVGSSLTNVETANPIRISELVVSASSEYDTATTTPIRTITDCYATVGANLAFNDLYHKGNMFLYLRRADAYAKLPTYVQSVTVKTVKGSDLDKNNGSTMPYDAAVYSLVGNQPGRLLAIDLTGNKNWQERTEVVYHDYIDGIGQNEYTASQAVDCFSHKTDYEVSLVWVSYTNNKTYGLSDIVIYESSDGSVPSEVLASDGSKTKPSGDSFRVGSKGTYYYLRSVYNMGNPITDVVIDGDIMLRNYWTSINTNGTASSYGKYYIKAEHFKKATLTYYISGIYTATGANETEALKSLLNQGCRYYCPFNLSPDGKTPLFVGYSLSTSYKNAFSGLILYDAGQDNTVDTIVKGRDTYTRVTDSLNSGVYDSIICMYLTNSVRKACETGGTKASNGHYITDITFFTGTDLNDYATGEKSLNSLDAKTRAYVESYIYDEKGEPVYWDIVTDNSGKIVNCNITAIKGGTLSTSAPSVYMYIHYSDNMTPYLESLSGSLFTNHPTASVIACACGGLLLAAALYLMLKKKKSTAERGER